MRQKRQEKAALFVMIIALGTSTLSFDLTNIAVTFYHPTED